VIFSENKGNDFLFLGKLFPHFFVLWKVLEGKNPQLKKNFFNSFLV